MRLPNVHIGRIGNRMSAEQRAIIGYLRKRHAEGMEVNIGELQPG